MAEESFTRMVAVCTEKILFVDDEEMVTTIGKEMRLGQGYSAVTCNSSVETFEVFQNSLDDFDLVIADQTMPELTGSVLEKTILQIRPEIPIILCTGYINVISKEGDGKEGMLPLSHWQ